MGEIKLISKETDFAQIKLSRMGWDTWCYKKPYEVYRIEGYNHSIGGRWGENCYWACELGQIPTYETLVEFGGEPCCWSFTIESKNSMKTKWDETEIRHNYGCSILRNDQVFYQFGANDMDYGISRIRQLLFLIQEHAISFNERGFEKQILGRKIFWREQPAIITGYSMAGNLTIIPDGQRFFNPPCYRDEHEEGDMDEDESDIAEDLFAPSIYWFRN